MSSTEGRYSRINCRVWNDERVRKLGPLAKRVWLRLLAPIERGRIPGLFQAWPDGIRLTVGLTVGEFDTSWLEVVSTMGAKHDPEAGLIYLPNALKHDPPRNPNQVKGWLSGLRELPECSLKAEAIRDIKQFLESLGPSFAKPLAELVPNTNHIPCTKNQVDPKQGKSAETSKSDALDSMAIKVWEHYARRYDETVNKKRRLGRQTRSKLRTRLKTYTAEELIEAIDRMFLDSWSVGVGALELKRIIHSDEKAEAWLSKPPEGSNGKQGRVVQAGGAKPGDAEAMRQRLGLQEDRP